MLAMFLASQIYDDSQESMSSDDTQNADSTQPFDTAEKLQELDY